MKRNISSQDGFHAIEFLIVMALVSMIGFVGYRIISSKKDSNTTQSQTATSPSDETVRWEFDQNKLEWFAKTGTAPKCKDPLVFDQSPTDLSKIMVIGMPGSYRGFNYKPHGGMRLQDANSGKIDIIMPIDATLTGITRYYEGSPSELQYLLTFETDCGIAFRFDHLFSLSPEFQAIAETTPEPKKDDTSSNPNTPFERRAFKSGDLVATEVGFPKIKNFGFDFGVYDYRSRNEISKNSTWAAIHNMFQASEWFGVCWIDMLPASDQARAKQLALTVINPTKPNIVSDYCSFAPNRTLDFNNGQPVDG